MKVTIVKLGNRAALRLPAALLREWGTQIGRKIEIGSKVEARIEGSQLVLIPEGVPHYTLEELVASITPENRQEEINWGEPVANEEW